MGAPYVGEIRMFAGNFAINGWAFCNGATIPIAENPTLFQLIGTTYGGDGQETFQLPNLCGRVPIHMGTDQSTGTTYQIGEAAGAENVTLTVQQIPSHTHALVVSQDPASTANPANQVLASSGQIKMYFEGAPSVNLNALAVGSGGGSQPHENMQPFLVVNFIISLFGIFPSQT
jgi:microcystin-dependent protein